MPGKDSVQFMLKSNQDAVRKLLDDITEDEAVKSLNGICSPIKWQTGHIAFYTDYLVKILGGENTLPEKWIELYRGGTELSDEHHSFLPFDKMRAELYERFDALNEQVDNLDESKLQEEIAFSPEWKAKLVNGILMLGTHEFYHAGQITVARNILGRERPFG